MAKKVAEIRIENDRFIYTDYEFCCGVNVSLEHLKSDSRLYNFLSNLFHKNGLDLESFLVDGGVIDLYD